MNFEKFLFVTITAAVFMFSVISSEAQDEPRFRQGNKKFGLYLGAGGYGDSSEIIMGGSFQYFVTDSTAPGVKAMGSFSQNNLYQGFFIIDQYLYTGGDLLPSVFAEAGYYYSDLVFDTPVKVEGLSLEEGTRWKGGIGRLGLGLTSFMSANAAIRGDIYYQWFYVDFDKKVPGLTGPGFSAGVSFFL